MGPGTVLLVAAAVLIIILVTKGPNDRTAFQDFWEGDPNADDPVMDYAGRYTPALFDELEACNYSTDQLKRAIDQGAEGRIEIIPLEGGAVPVAIDISPQVSADGTGGVFYEVNCSAN